MIDIMNQKIFITAPQHSSKMYCFDRWLDNVSKLSYPNVQIYLSDNSDTEDNANYIRSKGVDCGWLPKLEEDETTIIRIARSHEDCRIKFLESGCDYMLHLETDIFAPYNTIERLLACNKPVISALYDVFEGFNRKSMVMALEDVHRNIKSYRSANFLEDMEPLFLDGTVKKVFQAGLGCMLIRKDIANIFEFRHDNTDTASADTFFSNDLFASKVDIYLATNLYCRHENKQWEQEPSELNLQF